MQNGGRAVGVEPEDVVGIPAGEPAGPDQRTDPLTLTDLLMSFEISSDRSMSLTASSDSSRTGSLAMHYPTAPKLSSDVQQQVREAEPPADTSHREAGDERPNRTG
jgi:hypothetical protein